MRQIDEEESMMNAEPFVCLVCCGTSLLGCCCTATASFRTHKDQSYLLSGTCEMTNSSLAAHRLFHPVVGSRAVDHWLMLL